MLEPFLRNNRHYVKHQSTGRELVVLRLPYFFPCATINEAHCWRSLSSLQCAFRMSAPAVRRLSLGRWVGHSYGASVSPGAMVPPKRM
jgi:hypothetical protein